MKEAERQILQDTLHKEVIRKIILLQSWLRMVLERRRFLRMRQAAVVLQVSLRTANLIFLTKQSVMEHSPPLGSPPSLQKPPFAGVLALPLCQDGSAEEQRCHRDPGGLEAAPAAETLPAAQEESLSPAGPGQGAPAA